MVLKFLHAVLDAGQQTLDGEPEIICVQPMLCDDEIDADA